MQTPARKFVVYTVAAALAVANGFAPRHAQGAMHPVALAVADHHEHAADQANHHHAPQKAAMPCHNEADNDPAPGSPLHNCCVASCSAVAFIFASFSFDDSLPQADYQVLPANDPIQAALNSADPPPR